MIDEIEIQERVYALWHGPWIEKGDVALALLKPPYPGLSVGADGSLDLRGNVQVGLNDAQIDSLSYALRPHDEDNEIEARFTPFRESLDEALGHLQLIELAIATGYVQVGDINRMVRDRIVNLLWSAPAKQYSQAYAFVLLRSLAARVDVRLFDTVVTPTEPIEDGDIRFAAFLGELTTWFDFKELDDFLNMLDDYEPGGISSATLAKTVKAAKEFSPEQLHLLVGADAFLTKAATIFGPLGEAERPLYGGYLSYWIARFFGYELKGARYERIEWRVDWSKCLLADGLLSEEGRAVYSEAIEELKRTWEVTRQHIEAILATESLG